MEKKKIYFLAPKSKWGTYFYYKEISEYFIKNHSDVYDIKFCNSFLDYIKLHFIKTDIIFSIIPLFFKPIFTKKYIFNLHWNFKIERKNKWLWVKLLYLSELNLWFSDKIMLTSYYLADKLNFRKKYEYKIVLIPFFVNNIITNNKKIDSNNIKLLTVSSSNFLKKWLGIYDLAKELSKIKKINILWEVIFPWDEKNKEFILKKINSLEFWNNIKIKFYDFVERDKLNYIYKNTDIFIYSSWLETWWWTIMEALSFWKPVILLKNDLWGYIYLKEFITNNFNKSFFKVIKNYSFYSNLSYHFSMKYKKELIIGKLVNNLI